MIILEVLLVGLVGLVVYVHVGYPIVLLALRRFGRAPDAAPITPPVTIFIAAHNEAKVIGEKLRTSLALDYPREALEIVVASDGSSDGTAEVARAFEPAGVVVREAARRGGKNAAINAFVPATRGQILVFTDANAFFERSAIRTLVRNFADPEVGLVAGNLRYVDAITAVAKGEGLYFRYEAFLKALESRLGTLVAATGSIYAIRRELFSPLDPDVANDFAHPIQVAAKGYRTVFERGAVACERATASPAEEFRRKARIVTRGLTAFARYRREFGMLRGLWGFCFISHKLLRWFTGAYLVGILLASAALASGSSVYGTLLAAQGVFYGTALVGWAAGSRRGRLLAVPFYFCMINAAAVVGIVRYLKGTRQVTWEQATSTR